MESQEIVWKFFMKQKSVVTSVENFLDDFIEIYEKSTKREQEVLSECIQQMFRKYYYSTLMPDTYLSTANMMNSLTEREYGKEFMVLPTIQVEYKAKKIKHFHCGIIQFNSEDHYVIKDLEYVLKKSVSGVPLIEPGIIPYEERKKLFKDTFLNDRHYMNIITLVALEAGLLEYTEVGDRVIGKTSAKAEDFFNLEQKEKLHMIIDAAILLFSKAIIQSLPELKNEFSVEKIKKLLKKPKEYESLISGILNKYDIDILQFTKDLLTSNPEDTDFLNDKEVEKIYKINTLQSILDMYFFTPFGYYLQLIQPTYSNVYDMYEEVENILEDINDVQSARVKLFSAAESFDLTPLGESLLIKGRKPKRNQGLSKKITDDDMVNIVRNSYKYIDRIEDFDEENIGDQLQIMDLFEKMEQSLREPKQPKYKQGDKAMPHYIHDKMVFVFKAKVFYNKRISRTIEIKGNQTLDDLHESIFESFELEEGHLYSFFMSNKAWDKDSEYSHPQAYGRSADNIKISALNLQKKQKFIYLYDYGDEYLFEVELMDVKEAEEGIDYPRKIQESKRR